MSGRESQGIYSHSYVREALPHRYPFLLVDRVLELRDGEIRAVKNVTADEPFFAGHFPGEPIFPGVLLLEGLAQTAGLLLNAQHAPDAGKREGQKGYLTGIERARFRRLVRPGDQLVYAVRLLKERRGFYKFTGQALVGQNPVAEAQFTIALPEVR